MTFNDLNLDKSILSALEKQNYLTPTPIQQQAIPHLLKGEDLFGCAQTGTGKTAAFALPILQMLNAKAGKTSDRSIKALILAPTRELASQINDSIKSYSVNLPIRSTVVFGGVSQLSQTTAIKNGVDILVATPGRLMDLISQGFIKLNNIEFFVLDEADRMLDMGFIADIRRIVAKIPATRQTLLFSATMPPDIKKLADQLLRNPAFVNVSPVSSTSVTVEQSVYYVEKADKKELLQFVLQNSGIDHALVFTRTKHGADKVAKDLTKKGIRSEAIHGDKSQNSRQRALKSFKNREIRVLVATDIASRGIDVEKLTHVINFELPEQPETYVHRIGRTGRAGESGNAISFCTLDERAYLNSINRLIKKTIDVVKVHPFSK